MSSSAAGPPCASCWQQGGGRRSIRAKHGPGAWRPCCPNRITPSIFLKPWQDRTLPPDGATILPTCSRRVGWSAGHCESDASGNVFLIAETQCGTEMARAPRPVRKACTSHEERDKYRTYVHRPTSTFDSRPRG